MVGECIASFTNVFAFELFIYIKSVDIFPIVAGIVVFRSRLTCCDGSVHNAHGRFKVLIYY